MSASPWLKYRRDRQPMDLQTAIERIRAAGWFIDIDKDTWEISLISPVEAKLQFGV